MSMINSLAKILILAAWVQLAWANRIMEQPEDAYELEFQAVRLPLSPAGAVIVQTCADCETISLGLTGATQYLVDGRAVSFVELSEIAAGIRSRREESRKAAVYVYFDTNARTVNRLALDTTLVR